MAKAFLYAKTVLAGGAVAAGLIGFAGAASAATPDQTCWGGIPAGSAHKPFSHASPGNEGCGNHDDTSKTSMADMASAGSYKDSNPAFAVSPWTKAHQAA